MSNQKEIVFKIKSTKPLILNLTNSVTNEFVANSLLALGAAPIMSNCKEEIEELVRISSAIYINIGTLNHEFIELCKISVRLATKYQKPIILDPVGAGATNIRTKTAIDLAPYAKIIRGNASEIAALNNETFISKGVEAVHSTEDVSNAANHLAQNLNNTIVVSGKTDYITDGRQFTSIKFGSSIMTNVTGMGCSLTAILAAFLAVEHDVYKASVAGTKYFSLCGEIAAQNCKVPGSFRSLFIDQLYNPNYDLMREIENK